MSRFDRQIDRAQQSAKFANLANDLSELRSSIEELKTNIEFIQSDTAAQTLGLRANTDVLYKILRQLKAMGTLNPKAQPHPS